MDVILDIIAIIIALPGTVLAIMEIVDRYRQ